MPNLTIDPDLLKPNGSILSRPTMLLAAVIASANDDAEVSILKCYYGQPMVDLLNRRNHQGLPPVAALLFLSPPQVNKTERWRVDLIDDFGRTQVSDRQGGRFTTYAYRTVSGLIYIDNALPDPSYFKRWRSRFRLENLPEMDDKESENFRQKIATYLEQTANDFLLHVENLATT
jgi:hypothetical protein